MNELVIPIQLSDGALQPALSSDLKYYVNDLLEPSKAVEIREHFPPHVVREAVYMRDDFAALCGSASRKMVADWVMSVAGGVANPPDKSAIAVRFNSIAQTSGDLPCGVWTAATAAMGKRLWRFFPSDSEVDGLLRPLAMDLSARRDALAKIAANPSPAPSNQGSRPEPTQRERKVVRELVGAYQAEVQTRKLGKPRQSGAEKPLYLSREQLIKAYREQEIVAVWPELRELAKRRLEHLEATPI